MAAEQSDAQADHPAAGLAAPLPIVLHQVLAGPLRRALPAELRFDARVPYVVALAFQPPQGPAVEWFIGRDLLWDGVLDPSGIHEVRIAPIRRGGRLLLRIRLGGRGMSALFETDLHAVEQWLLETYGRVPFGEDLASVDWDARLIDLLNGR